MRAPEGFSQTFQGTASIVPRLAETIARPREGTCPVVLPLVITTVIGDPVNSMPLGGPPRQTAPVGLLARIETLRAAVAVPVMRIGQTANGFGRVERGIAVAEALAIANDGDAVPTVTVRAVTRAAGPDRVRVAELPETPGVTIAPGAPPPILRRVFELQASPCRSGRPATIHPRPAATSCRRAKACRAVRATRSSCRTGPARCRMRPAPS